MVVEEVGELADEEEGGGRRLRAGGGRGCEWRSGSDDWQRERRCRRCGAVRERSEVGLGLGSAGAAVARAGESGSEEE